jgi:predicted lipoprotein with Yx(FWY)xxD motif/plastocyanin
MKTMKTTQSNGILLILCILFFAGCTNNQEPASTTTTTQMTESTTIPSVGILIRQTTAGMILTDGSGMTLYTYDMDGLSKSNCTGQCLVNWPPVLTPQEGPSSIPGDLYSDITHFQRDDSRTQASYKGMPLYYYIGDSSPGDMKGDGIGGIWHIVKIGATQPTTTKPTTTMKVTPTTFMGTPRTVDVLINVFGYDPSPLTVTVGDTVVWKSMQTQMTVTSPGNASDRELDSPVLGPSETYSHTFTKVGAYDYYSTTNERVNGRIYVTSDLDISAS